MKRARQKVTAQQMFLRKKAQVSVNYREEKR
jgi:hypothetical protein